MYCRGWPANKVQVRAFPLGQSIIALTNDSGKFLDTEGISIIVPFIYNTATPSSTDMLCCEHSARLVSYS